MKRIDPTPQSTEAPPEEDRALEALIAEALAEPASAELPPEHARVLRSSVLQKVAQSAQAHRELLTARKRHAQWKELSQGVRERLLTDVSSARDNSNALRPGQPLHAAIVRMELGSALPAAFDDASVQREWLVLEGDVELSAADVGTLRLGALDFHVAPAGCPQRFLQSQGGATFYVRHGVRSTQAAAEAIGRTVFNASAPWQDFASSIQRRVLWSCGGEAAYLIRAARGASVPGHGHAHDEECLMIDGDLFLGDILLQAGDYQLAPAGTRHGDHYTDTGLTLLVRGDAEMMFDA